MATLGTPTNCNSCHGRVSGSWCSGPWTALFVARCCKGPLHCQLWQQWLSPIKTLLSSAFLHLFFTLSQTAESIFAGWTERWEHIFILLTETTTMTVHKSHFQLFSHVIAIVFCGQKHQQALTCCRMSSKAAFQQASSAADMLGEVELLHKRPPWTSLHYFSVRPAPVQVML